MKEAHMKMCKVRGNSKITGGDKIQADQTQEKTWKKKVKSLREAPEKINAYENLVGTQ